MYKREIEIPIQRENRTFEECRHQLLNNLEETFSKKTSTRSTSSSTSAAGGGGGTGVGVGASSAGFSGGNREFRKSMENLLHEDWDQEVNQWIRDTRSKWEEDIQRMRKQFFNLETKPSSSPVHQIFSMEENNKQKFPFVEESSTLSSTSRTQNSNSTSSSSSSTSQFQQTSSSSFSSSSSQQQQQQQQHSSSPPRHFTSFGIDKMMDKDFHKRSSLNNLSFNKMATTTTTSTNSKDKFNAFDLSNDLYELGEDGELHFKVRFNVQNFSPEDIQVLTEGRRLKVKGKNEEKKLNSSNYQEFSREIDLPDTIDHAKFLCHMTKDGILVIDAPVKAPDYLKLHFSHQGELGVKPTSGISSGNQLNKTGQNGPQIIKTSNGNRKIHIEMEVESDYKQDDIHVRAVGHKIIIEGRHEEKCGGRSFMKQFTKCHEIPEAVDPLSIAAHLYEGCLVVEIPLQN